MHLRHGEHIERIVKRHKTPFAIRILKVSFIVLPLFLALIYLEFYIDSLWPIFLILILALFLLIIFGLICIDYLLDKLIITNKRVIWVNWISPFRHEEHEAELLDIQDIETRESGFLSKLPLFDYGFLEIETASSKVCIAYTDCPSPDKVKHFILNTIEKTRGGIHEKWEPPEEEEEWSVN